MKSMSEKESKNPGFDTRDTSENVTDSCHSFVSSESQNVESVSAACQDIRQQALNTFLKWTETLNDSEKFDNFYETRIDELIKEAILLEETLVNQKHVLKERLKNLTKTLAMVAEM